jgi:hypothetical protein
MSEQTFSPWRKFQQNLVSRRSLIRGAGAAMGAGVLRPHPALADDDDRGEHASCALAAPIPGGVKPFLPFGVFVHHNPLSPANATAVGHISDPSQITDFDGFVGLTHIRGSGTGTNTETSETMALKFQADMGFSHGKFIGVDGRSHHGTLVFV